MIPQQDLESQILGEFEVLDLFSTSHTFSEKCHRQAPFICIPPTDGKPAFLYHGCCNDWLCPRCGKIRARDEYARIINGCDVLAQTNTLYFVTFTCQGKISLQEAVDNYLIWTDALLNRMRMQAKRDGKTWAYVQVTEPQKRQHPHSHLIMASAPNDAKFVLDNWQDFLATIKRVNAKIPIVMRFKPDPKKDYAHTDMYSEWLMLTAVKCGLGVQCRISVVDVAAAVSRYVAKYLFKVAMVAKWSKNWRRIRYSQSFPKLPEYDSKKAFPVLTKQDWQRVARIKDTINTDDPTIYAMALVRHIWNIHYIPPKNHINGQK